jgi:hypothetical protein
MIFPLDSPSTVLPYLKISFFPWTEEEERERVNILGYGNTGDGESRDENGKLIIRVFNFNFISINET